MPNKPQIIPTPPNAQSYSPIDRVASDMHPDSPRAPNPNEVLSTPGRDAQRHRRRGGVLSPVARGGGRARARRQGQRPHRSHSLKSALSLIIIVDAFIVIIGLGLGLGLVVIAHVGLVVIAHVGLVVIAHVGV